MQEEQRGEEANGERKGFTVGDIWVRKQGNVGKKTQQIYRLHWKLTVSANLIFATSVTADLKANPP